jgi:hypothetical protein
VSETILNICFWRDKSHAEASLKSLPMPGSFGALGIICLVSEPSITQVEFLMLSDKSLCVSLGDALDS